MNDEVVGMETNSQRPGAVWKERKMPLFFTVSAWAAVSHISPYKVALEYAYPDPYDVFPGRVMRMVDYGINHGGLDCRVVEYATGEGTVVGCILYLTAGKQAIGCYAMRYDDGLSRASQTIQTPH